MWENWDVLVIPTRYKCRIKSEVPKVLEEGFRLLNYRNTQSALSDLMLQANGF
jgi:hypothetical protein